MGASVGDFIHPANLAGPVFGSRLGMEKRNTPEDRLDVLVTLVEAWERKHNV
jgi:hypothetical protein